jgi:hypothetical protein
MKAREGGKSVDDLENMCGRHVLDRDVIVIIW